MTNGFFISLNVVIIPFTLESRIVLTLESKRIMPEPGPVIHEVIYR